MENKENKFHAICYIHKYDLKSDKGGYKKMEVLVVGVKLGIMQREAHLGQY